MRHAAWILLLVLAQDGDPKKACGKATAWQEDKTLEEKWRIACGRAIFQKSCVSCHSAGPEEFTRKEWEQKLKTLPAKGHDGVAKSFDDLTAPFPFGEFVPGKPERIEAVRRYAMSASGDRRRKKDPKAPPIDLLPSIGKPAPDFLLKDESGVEHSLKAHRGRSQVLLAVSRAHWDLPGILLIAALQKRIEGFRAAGTAILILEPEGPSGFSSRQLAILSRFHKIDKLDFPVLNDERVEASALYAPTSAWLIDKEGVLRERWLDHVHRRTDADAFLAAAEKLNAAKR